MRRLLSALFVSALVLGGVLFSACSSGSSDDVNPYIFLQQKVINPTSTATATSLSLYAPSEVSIGEATSAVNVSFAPANARVIVSCNTNIVSFVGEPEEIEGSYLVRFKPNALGSFVITAQSGLKTASLTIYVTQKVVSVQVEGGDNPIDKDATVQLSAKKTPASSTAKVKWASSDKNVATVDQNGLVKAVNPGVATITATVSNSDQVSFGPDKEVVGYKDITVKGFFLSDTSFFLCQKDQDDEVEAKVIGIEGATVEWESSNPSLFTVAAITADKRKAKLSYVPSADGQGEVTAKLKDGSGNVLFTAKADVYVHKFYMLALGDSIAAGYAPKAIGEGANDADLEEAAMLEAYNKYMDRRKGGDNPHYVNEFAYPAVLKSKLAQSSNVTLHSYAMSGDNTTMLLDKLKDNYRDGTIATKQGEIMEAVKQADFITLCIGANDILLKVFGTDLITKTPEEFKKAFEDEVPGFKSRFDQIIKTLTANGQQVYVMSIFSPYKYFKKRADSGFIPDEKFNDFYGSWVNKIVKINNYAEPVITQINDYIKTVATSNPNVTFVDVAPVFDGMGNEDHKKNLHPVPERMDFTKLLAGMGKKIPIWFDPHPTIKGAEKIAEKYNEVLQ